MHSGYSRYNRGYQRRGRRMNGRGRYSRNKRRRLTGQAPGNYVVGSRMIKFLSPKRNGVPMPQAYFCKHPYANQVFHQQAVTRFAFDERIPTSIDDIDGAGQTYAWATQMFTMFNSYCVYAFKWTVQASNQDNFGVYLGVTPWPDDEDPTSFNDAVVRTGTKFKYLAELGTPRDIVSQSGYVDVAKLYGVTREQLLAEEDFWGTDGGSPFRLPRLYIWFNNGLDAGITTNVDYQLKLTAYVKWFSRNAIPIA